MEKKHLYKSDNSMIAGVCGGLGEYMEVDPTIIRLGWVLLTMFYGFGLILYIILAIIIPARSDEYREKTNDQENREYLSAEQSEEQPKYNQNPEDENSKGDRKMQWSKVHTGIQLITIGSLILLWNLGLLQFPALRTLYYFWPVFLIGAGLSMVLRKWPVMQSVIFLVTIFVFLTLGMHLEQNPGYNILRMGEDAEYTEFQENFAGEDSVSLHADVSLGSGEISAEQLEDDELYILRSENRNVSGDYSEGDRSLTVRDTDKSSGLFFAPFRDRNWELVLNSEVPWIIHADSNAGQMRWHLQDILLEEMYLDGNVSDIELYLPEPVGTVKIEASGNVADLTLYLPENASYRVVGSGSLAQVTIDGNKLSGEVTSETFTSATNRYDIDIQGSLADLKIEFY